MSGSVLRVLVVEDSLTVRRRIVEVLEQGPGFVVVGEASNGRDGIELAERLRPDVITMDMVLPDVTGVEATEHIMAWCPTPILIVSASTNRGELFKTYDALAAGAVDVLDKPDGDDPEEEWESRLKSTLRVVSRVRVITHPRGRLSRARPQRPVSPLIDTRSIGAVAIGASTGGPGAILTLLRELPQEFRTPILLVIHISTTFGSAMAEWLNEQTPMEVRYARDGEPLPARAAQVLMAPPERHLLVRGGRLRLSDEPERHSCRPSVDVLFESVARELGSAAVGCLLTGMGRDGASGLLAMREAGGMTIAQDAESSVVFGMPGEAVRLGAARQVLALRDIAPALARLDRRAGED